MKASKRSGDEDGAHEVDMPQERPEQDSCQHEKKKTKARAKASVAFVARRAMTRHSAHKWCVPKTVFCSWRNNFAVPQEAMAKVCRCKGNGEDGWSGTVSVGTICVTKKDKTQRWRVDASL